jgi:deoxyribonucleoside regulator
MKAITKEEYEKIISLGAVGIIAGRFYDFDGNEVCMEIDDRTMSLPLEDIKKKKMRIGIAVGLEKVNAIIGALRGKIFNRFYTDERTAIAVIEKARKL